MHTCNKCKTEMDMKYFDDDHYICWCVNEDCPRYGLVQIPKEELELND